MTGHVFFHFNLADLQGIAPIRSDRSFSLASGSRFSIIGAAYEI